ncbi:MAG: ATP-dependent Clp protease ATP-binding subunit, partial [Bacteroidales bacterium]|nr:ATP-dependent Clp protease ATP-binding subunit [Bacteroidales bacterium]
MHLQLSEELNDIITYAKEEAIRLGSYTIATDHLILGILRHGENSASAVLHKMGVNLFELKKKIEEKIKKSEIIPIENSDRIILSKASENALKVMFLEARAMRVPQPEAAHLLLAILRGQDWSCAMDFFESNNISYSSIKENLTNNKMKDSEENNGFSVEDEPNGNNRQHNGESDKEKSNTIKGNEAARKKGSATPVLDSFGFDLTKAALEEKLDPVVGREKEIERLAQILGRRKKNNPVLIGEPGVGKSAIAEGLAIRIAKKSVSRILMNKRIISLDIGSIVAGTKYRGQFEERM